MLHKMKLNESPFEKIKNGTKTVEFRLFDEKRKTIKVGDQIEFSKLPDMQEKLLVDVVELYNGNKATILDVKDKEYYAGIVDGEGNTIDYRNISDAEIKEILISKNKLIK